jgi:hypothetical protein
MTRTWRLLSLLFIYVIVLAAILEKSTKYNETSINVHMVIQGRLLWCFMEE